MNEGTTVSRPGSARPLGLITNDPAAVLIAKRLAATGHRVICLALEPARAPCARQRFSGVRVQRGRHCSRVRGSLPSPSTT